MINWLSFFVFLFGFSFSIAHANLLGPARNSRADLTNTLRGSLSYLEDTQIRDRPSRLNCRRDFSGGSGCAGSAKNIEGEWANFIYPLNIVSYMPPEDDLVLIQDSNMFVTSAILYPLYWLSDATGDVDNIRKLALDSIRTYQREDAYSFWPQYQHQKSQEHIVGPLNFPIEKLKESNYGIARTAAKVLGHFIPWVEEWMLQILDTENNKFGMASFFNVPNDADDTSVAMAMITVEAMKGGNAKAVDRGPLETITRYRDVDRVKADARDNWTPKDTGAYLTWLKDENLSVFSDARTGIVPMGVNNVDCVVNANVMFALSLNDMNTAPGFSESATYLANVVETSQWLKQCALYYPQKYTFAYSITRAYRDGGARTPALDLAMNKMMRDLLEQQKRDGSWCSSADGTCHYATAMALVSLLNIGEVRAKGLSLLSAYENALDRGINFLNSAKKRAKVANSKFHHESYQWKPGLFFSAEDYHLGVWRSVALTNAIVIEALAKYLMDYQKSQATLKEWKKTLPVL